MLNESQKDNEYDQEILEESDAVETDDDLVTEEEQSTDKIKQLRKKLQACEADKQQYLEEVQRIKADYLNSKRRLEEQKQADVDRAVRKQVEQIIPVYDSFRMAMSDTGAWEAIDSTWRKGIEQVYAQLQKSFTNSGVAIVDPVGEPFDPNRHEAMGTVPVSSEDQHDTVVDVMQAGFTRSTDTGEELIRPARVTVGSFERTDQ